ncbi:hypothetical protein H5410_044939 [Solanum commersonii]|uniref:Uncharacterized protein n=1 Tax=Solanum commersonii TaxID=4109 RepID=A0A9J5X871_SOLCO|nr:hypothetical protein H5410_044939 [Solanum commersonii]
MNSRIELQQLVKAEEISWRQIRMLMAQRGRQEHKVLPKIANSHRRGNCIDKLKVGTEIIEDKQRIKQEMLILRKFVHRIVRPSPTLRAFHPSLEEKFNLEATFQEEEVLAAIQPLPRQAHCDGYTMAFYRNHGTSSKLTYRQL